MMKMIGVGRFCRDPELKYVKDTCVCEFSLAINEYRKVKDGEKKKISSFLDFQIWDKAAELICQYCRKGDEILIEATPRQDKWQDKDGNNRSKIIFRVDNFNFVGGSHKEEESAVEETAY